MGSQGKVPYLIGLVPNMRRKAHQEHTEHTHINVLRW